MLIVKAFALSFFVGVVVGLLYAAIKVNAPVPPLAAFFGLLGILLGEQIPQIVRSIALFASR